ncbi:hypothetical protein QCE62_00140 [Caballeronia sp. LZ033]|uniref:hypothetical protein n=1 Tax=Caballeronia sp. LZ033 TaxID=3038566 RepID=UPI002856C5F6|nr:hypothetical protein [Caballeronia sp. LZ033]MDR5811996.1 hypothetical protein [Caballeronia sp. LZ033]
MKDTTELYVLVNADTGADMYDYQNQAPATALAKNISRGTRVPRIRVEKRVFKLVSTETVRTIEHGKRV